LEVLVTDTKGVMSEYLDSGAISGFNLGSNDRDAGRNVMQCEEKDMARITRDQKARESHSGLYFGLEQPPIQASMQANNLPSR
jgi:hypothetical protein